MGLSLLSLSPKEGLSIPLRILLEPSLGAKSKLEKPELEFGDTICKRKKILHARDQMQSSNQKKILYESVTLYSPSKQNEITLRRNI